MKTLRARLSFFTGILQPYYCTNLAANMSIKPATSLNNELHHRCFLLLSYTTATSKRYFVLILYVIEDLKLLSV